MAAAPGFPPYYYPYVPPEVLYPYEDLPPGVPPGRIVDVTEAGMRVLVPFHDESLTFCIPPRNPPPPNAWQMTPSAWPAPASWEAPRPGAFPYHPHTPLAPRTAPLLELSRQLSVNTDNPTSPWITWDIIHPPEIYARLYDRPFLRRLPPDLKDPAFIPNVKKVWVISTHPVLSYWMKRWGILSIKSENVTISEVLNGIYRYLQERLTPEDVQHASSIPGNQKSLRYALLRRAKDSAEIDAVVIRQGYRRVDILGGHRRFQGLHIQFLPDETWRLCLYLLPGPVPR